MKIIIAGGGTGGHIFPALSIAEEILQRDKNNKILFIGTKNGIEKRIIPEAGYEIRFISSGGLIGKNIFMKIRNAIYALNGLISSFNILRKFRPDVVIGVGGYASGPAVLSACLRNIPTAICEQNCVPGFTNRTLKRFVKKIFVTFEESKKHFPPEKTVTTGNPVRKSMKVTKNRNNHDDGYNILVLGGSQGARILNRTVPEAVSKLKNKKINIVHQTGEKDFDDVVGSYSRLDIKAEVYKFINNISDIYRETDLIICRSGAGTIAEITVMGIPSVLIPFPYAAHNHQFYNARVLEENNAAILIEEKDLNDEILSNHLDDILEHDKLEEYSANTKKFGRPDAAADIVNEIEKMAGNK